MSSNLDKSLDEVISLHKGRRGGNRRGVKSALLGSPANTRPRVVRPSRPAGSPTATPLLADNLDAEKIIVSNLPLDVNESQIRELFQTMVGPLRDVTLSYDAAGRSKGVASVVFTRKGDGTNAYNQYHNRLIDGKRPMKIEIVVDPARPIQAPSLVTRVATAASVNNATNPRGAFPVRGGGRGRGGRGRGRGKRGNDRPNKSLADLDAEMEDYTGTAPTATAAST